MECPKCGYALSPFDSSCPRCAQIGSPSAITPIAQPSSVSPIVPTHSPRKDFRVVGITVLAVAGGMIMGLLIRKQSPTPAHPKRALIASSRQPASGVSAPTRPPSPMQTYQSGLQGQELTRPQTQQARQQGFQEQAQPQEQVVNQPMLQAKVRQQQAEELARQQLLAQQQALAQLDQQVQEYNDLARRAVTARDNTAAMIRTNEWDRMEDYAKEDVRCVNRAMSLYNTIRANSLFLQYYELKDLVFGQYKARSGTEEEQMRYIGRR